MHGHINPLSVGLRVTQLFKLLGSFPLVVLLHGLYGVKGALLLKGLKDLGLVSAVFKDPMTLFTRAGELIFSRCLNFNRENYILLFCPPPFCALLRRFRHY